MNAIPQVSAIGVIALARQLKSLSLLDAAAIKAISPELLTLVNKLEAEQDISHTYDIFFPESWIIGLWQRVDDRHPDSPAGFLVGKTVAQEALGMLSSLTRFSETLGQALATYLQNIQYINQSEGWQMLMDGDVVTLFFSYPAHKSYPSNAIERSLVAMHAMGSYLCGRKIPGVTAQFRRSRPPYAELLEDYFQCPLEFSAPCNALVFPSSALAWPLQDPAVLLGPSLDSKKPYLKGVLRKSLQKSLEEKTNTTLTSSTLTGKVSALVRENPACYSNSKHVASALNMSRATLYRKLKLEGSQFSLIRDAIRQELMELHGGKKAIDVYEQLGFRDVSSFYKAKKRKNISNN